MAVLLALNHEPTSNCVRFTIGQKSHDTKSVFHSAPHLGLLVVDNRSRSLLAIPCFLLRKVLSFEKTPKLFLCRSLWFGYDELIGHVKRILAAVGSDPDGEVAGVFPAQVEFDRPERSPKWRRDLPLRVTLPEPPLNPVRPWKLVGARISRPAHLAHWARQTRAETDQAACPGYPDATGLTGCRPLSARTS